MIRPHLSRLAILIALTIAVNPQSGRLHAADWGKNYPDHLWQGISRGFSNPHWLFGAGAIAGLSAYDQEAQAAANGKLLPEGLAQIGNYYGLGINYLAGSACILTDGFNSRSYSHKQRLDNWQSFSEAYAVTAASTAALKLVTHRLRPDGSSHDAFPSGHTSTSACVAAHLNQRFGPGAGIPAAALATITGLSRLHHNRHWLSDVLAGALLGGLVGDGFGRLERKQAQPHASDLRWQMNLILVF